MTSGIRTTRLVRLRWQTMRRVNDELVPCPTCRGTGRGWLFLRCQECTGEKRVTRGHAARIAASIANTYDGY